MQTPPVPNHHAHHGGFSGFRGYLIGLSFLLGRDQVGAWAAELAGVTQGDAVVDIGCGPGSAARLAAKRGASVVGVDPAEVMLRLGRLFTRQKRVTYREGTAESLPVEDGSATVVWSLSTVHHWADLDAGLTEVRRVLKSGGRFVAIEANTTPGVTSSLVTSGPQAAARDQRRPEGHAGHGWTDDQAERFAGMCRDHGLIDVRIERRNADRRPRIAVVGSRS